MLRVIITLVPQAYLRTRECERWGKVSLSMIETLSLRAMNILRFNFVLLVLACANNCPQYMFKTERQYALYIDKYYLFSKCLYF